MDVKAIKDWDDDDIPPPNLGGSFAYCPHTHPEVVKEPKKRARTVHIKCGFKTRNIRKYRRHYARRHGTLDSFE